MRAYSSVHPLLSFRTQFASGFLGCFSIAAPGLPFHIRRNYFCSATTLPSLSLNVRNYSTTVPIVPIKIYRNADTDKLQIIIENKGKAGVYRWTNLKNGKTYVGSSTNLSLRMKEYYSFRYLETKILKSKSMIYSSILKHGYSSFSLEILEYCDGDQAISIEQYYLDLLNPEYNILKKLVQC